MPNRTAEGCSQKDVTVPFIIIPTGHHPNALNNQSADKIKSHVDIGGDNESQGQILAT